MDSAAKQTDKRLNEIEKSLKKLYKDAQGDITEAWGKYMNEQNAYVKDLQEAYQRAKLYGTDAEVREIGRELGVAKAERTLQNQYYKDMVKMTTEKMAEVNQTALAYVNNQMPWVYSTNFNAAAKDAEKVGFRFNLVDEGTVKRRVLDGDIKLPYKDLNKIKDARWNTKQLNSAVLQGIVNGESMQKIADRIFPIVGNNTSAAIRNARTMVTGAQNEGRQDSYEYMQDNGVMLHKVWMATHDERTRISHAEMDGEVVDVGEKFSNELMYPGDPSGAPEEVYNCRCTMVTQVYGFKDPETGKEKLVDIESYKPDYEFAQLEGVEPADNQTAKEDLPELEKLRGTMLADQYKEYMELIDSNEHVREVYRIYGNDVNFVKQLPSGGYYQPGLKSVNYSIEKIPDVSPYSTLAHEYGHALDHVARDGFTGATYDEIDKINAAVSYNGTYQVFKAGPSMSDQYLEALREDREFLAKELRKPDVQIDIKSSDASGGVQDLADGFFSTQSSRDKSTIGVHFNWGHGDSYYNRNYNAVKSWGKEKELRAALKDLGYDVSNATKAKRVTRNYEAASELWANQMSALTCGGKELEYMEKYTPNTLAALKGLLKGVK